MSALFSQLQSIDQSSGKTAGLRTVTKEMKSGANKDAPPVPVKSPSAAAGAGVAKGRDDGIPSGTAIVQLQDKRWAVEFQQTAGTQLHLSPEPQGEQRGLEINHEVYIYACKDVAIFVDAKCKGVKVDKCKNVTLIVNSLLSGIEIVNCKKIKMQVQAGQSLPSVAIDKSDGVTVGLSFTSRAAQVVSSKSSEMNVYFPLTAAEDSEWVELPIPEQFVSKLSADNKLHTEVSELYSK